jgi:hypothetical protein
MSSTDTIELRFTPEGAGEPTVTLTWSPHAPTPLPPRTTHAGPYRVEMRSLCGTQSTVRHVPASAAWPSFADMEYVATFFNATSMPHYEAEPVADDAIVRL